MIKKYGERINIVSDVIEKISKLTISTIEQVEDNYIYHEVMGFILSYFPFVDNIISLMPT